MKKKIVLGVLLAVIIVAAIGTYMYRHRFDKYEQSQEEQTAGIKAIGKDSRFLVTYFSWPSPDYPCNVWSQQCREGRPSLWQHRVCSRYSEQETQCRFVQDRNRAELSYATQSPA